ncbi:MAG: hypothetical protein RSB38_06845, partial [Oscillospiraceae bacterium]
VVYTYAEYKEYGSGVYFAGTTTNSSVKNNLFSYSGLTFDSTDNSTINVENNTFNGIKNWNNDPAYYYSAIGYTSWENPAVLDISNSTLTIKKNKFINTGKVNFGKVTNGTVDATDNYWGSATPDFTKLVVGNVNVSPYFSDEAMTKKDSVTEQTAFTVANNAELSEALLKAADGATITLKANTDVGNKYNKISIYKNNITIVGETGVTATIEGIDIYGKGTVLKNLTSSENIVIMETVGNGNVKLDGVTIATGKILDVRGGGKNSVVITGGTSIPGVKINKETTAAGAEIVRIVVDSTASIANISVDSAGTIQVNGTQIAKVDVNTTDSVSIAGGGTIPTLNVASGIVTVQEGSTVGTATITGGLTDIKGTATTVNVSAGETTVSGTATTLNTTGGNTILSGTATTLNTTGGDTTTTPASKVTGTVTSNGGTTTVGGSAATVTATSGAVTTEKTAIVQQLNANGGTAKVSGKIEKATVAGTTVTVDTGANIAAATISAGSIAGTATDSVIGKIEVAGGTVDTTSKIVSATIENGVTSPGFTKDSGNVLNITDKNAGNTNNKTTATATFELVGQTVNQNAGTMTVDLKLTNAVQGVAGFKAVVDYSAFSTYITNATASTIAPNGVLMEDNGAGKITLTMAKGENIATNSVLATLTFNIKDDYYDVMAKSGKLGLTVSSAGYIDTLDTTGTPSREILPANIIVIGGEVVIEPWKYMLGDTDKNMNFNLMDIINTMVEVNRSEKKFKPWQKAATNIVIESAEPITSNPTAVDAQAMLEAFHYGTPLLRK